MYESALEHAVAAANGILNLPQGELAARISDMMSRKELHATVCELNDLLATPGKGELAAQALDRIGLSLGG